MILKSLKLNNFRQFKGESIIIFSNDPNRNVTIILGDNTHGKTTILQAFNWCFYGKANLDNPNSILNYIVEDSMKDGDSEDVITEIILEHENMEYTITRSQKALKANGKIVYARQNLEISFKQEDGQTKPIKMEKCEKVINSIMPEGLSSYFFFDTERVQNISERKDLTDSVKGLLGLTAISNAIKHLGNKSAKSTVIGKFYAALDLDKNGKAEKVLAIMQDASQRREVISQRLKTLDEEISYYENKVEKLDRILRENATTAELQQEEQELKRDIDKENIALDKLHSRFHKEFNYYGGLEYFSIPLIDEVSQLLQKMEIDDKGVSDITARSIHEIINRGKCICGTAVKENDSAYQHLFNELKFVPPESIGTTVNNFHKEANRYKQNGIRSFDNLLSFHDEIVRTIDRIQEWSDRLLDISEEIKGKEDMRDYEIQRSDYKKRLNDFRIEKESLIREDGKKQSEIESSENTYEKLIAATKKNEEMMKYIAYAEYISEWLWKNYNEREAFIRLELEKKVNHIFERMYHGKRKVLINDKYQVTLLTNVSENDVRETGESEGLRRVKNFAFISGLVALAKEKIFDEDQVGESFAPTPYPLVMDAPFSNADEIHVGRISRVLPEIAEQVVMFVMEKDWKVAEPNMEMRIGRRYRINKHDDVFSEIVSEG